MPTFTLYDPEIHAKSSLTSALLSPSSGIAINAGTINLKYGTGTAFSGEDEYDTTSIAFYDGSISGLGIGTGLLLTSGDGRPPEANTESGYSVSLSPSETDTDLNSTVHTAFPSAGDVQDATVLEFDFNVSDSTLTSIRFNIIFGSDEYPEFEDSLFVDIAGVYVNDVNYALFNNRADQPLSILETNLDAGNYRDNEDGVIPLEYDGISNLLTIVAPISEGTNTIKIAIADTGDEIYDSGIFIGNLHAVDFDGSGLALETKGSSLDDFFLQGNDFNEFFDLGGGNDVVLGGEGDDVFDGGDGFDAAIFSGNFSSYDLSKLFTDNFISGPDGSDNLNDIEFGLFGDDLFSFDTEEGGSTYNVYALLQAAFDQAPSTELLSQWVKEGMGGDDSATLAQQMIDTYAPGVSNDALISHLFQTVAGIVPTQSQIDEFGALIGPGDAFETQGDLVAFAALLDLNTEEFSPIVGTPIPLDLSQFI